MCKKCLGIKVNENSMPQLSICICICIIIVVSVCAAVLLFDRNQSTTHREYEAFRSLRLAKDSPYEHNVHFLDKQSHELRRALNHYTKRLTRREEFFFKSQGQILGSWHQVPSSSARLSFYLSKVTAFSDKQRQALLHLVTILKSQISDTSLHAIVEPSPQCPWKFVQLSADVENGMPFTLNDIIFLPTNFVENIPALYKDKDKDKENDASIREKTFDTLLHERLHTLQRCRRCQDLFRQFYTNHLGCRWESPGTVHISPFWREQIMSNPDGMDLGWTYGVAGTHHSTKRYLPLLLFSKSSQSVQQVVVEMVARKRSSESSVGLYTTRNSWSIRQSPIDVFRQFPSSISCYHPNEISAYALSKIMLGTYSSPFLLTHFHNLLTRLSNACSSLSE